MALVFPRGYGDLIREEFQLGPVDRLGGLVVITPAHRAGDLGSNPGVGENFSLKLLMMTSIYKIRTVSRYSQNTKYRLQTVHTVQLCFFFTKEGIFHSAQMIIQSIF